MSEQDWKDLRSILRAGRRALKVYESTEDTRTLLEIVLDEMADRAGEIARERSDDPNGVLR